MLPDRSILIGQKLVENAKIKKFKCDILSDFKDKWKRKKPFEKKCYWSLDWSLPKDGQNVLFTLVSFHECRRLDPFCLSFSFCHLHRNPPKNWFEINDFVQKNPCIQNNNGILDLHTLRNLHFLSKNSTLISRENCQLFWGRKTRENVVVLYFLAVDNFDFTRKNVKKKFG